MSETQAPVVASNALLGSPFCCPFCGSMPQFYDGEYHVRHDTHCYLYDHNEYQWIIGRDGISKWNARKPNVTGQGTAHLVRRTLHPIVRPVFHHSLDILASVEHRKQQNRRRNRILGLVEPVFPIFRSFPGHIFIISAPRGLVVVRLASWFG